MIESKEERIFKFIILVGYSILIGSLFFTNKLQLYIHPRLHWYMIGSAILLLIISFILLSIKGGEHQSFITYVIFIVPLLLAMIVPPDVSQFDLSSTRILITGDATLTGMSTANEYYESFNDENFWNNAEKIGLEPEKYHGTPVNISGFIFRNEGMEDGEMAIARLKINCCLADGRIVGAYVRHIFPASLDSKKWYSIDGTIDTTTGEPVILILDYKEIEPPEDPYAY